MEATPIPDSAQPPAPAASVVSDSQSPTACELASCASPTIAVLHASVGNGHRVAAEAVAQALEQLRDLGAQGLLGVDPSMRVTVIDMLEKGRVSIDGDKTALMFTGPTRPIYDITWRYWLTGRLLWAGGTIWSRIMFPDFTRWVRDNRPVAVVATHITAANVAVGARMITGQKFPIVCVPTDYEVEGMWPHRYGDLYCVACDSMAETLRARRVDEKRILLTGIPARSEFRQGYSRDQVRQDWNIPSDKLVALVLAGANLAQPYLRFREILDKALPELKLIDNLHLVFLAGSDSAYEQALRDAFARERMHNASVLGYTTDVAKLMAASDLCICKPGGLTVTECLCTKTPMMLVGRAYGQEKCNARLLTSLGAALHVQTARELGAAVRHVALHQPSLLAMKANEGYLGRSDAAMKIAVSTLQMAFSQHDAETIARWGERTFMSFYWGNQPAHTR